jgi:hypothetical protein
MLTAAEIPFAPNNPQPALDPSAASIPLVQILVLLVAFVRRFVVVTDHQVVAIALWLAHTHVIDAFDCTPYLQVTSATKRSGKTRLLEISEPLVARPWLTQRVSAAALVRKIDAEHPTLLLDESDAAFKGDREYAEALRGLLNSGYRRSGHSTICTGQGANITYRDFSTFSAKAIAGIGDLPDTVADRSIAIALRRRTHDEPCERWKERDGHAAADPLRKHLAGWASRTVVETLRIMRPDIPTALGDRQADCWEPLLAIADLAGGEWPVRARSAAIALTDSIEDTDIVVQLLSDIEAAVLSKGAESVIPTKTVLEELIALEDRPWATWRHEKPITGRGLARLLGPLGIHPVHTERLRGYRRDAFDDAVSRYLPSKASLRHSVNENGPESQISSCQMEKADDGSKTAKHADFIGELTHRHIEQPEQPEIFSGVTRLGKDGEADERF